ncbi:glycosyltransferase family 39 protein [Candidatus Woesebacteria bacterium]|nr:glycosyltransferase family 39 protein [Candidatus Woesebacteria bacterium]
MKNFFKEWGKALGIGFLIFILAIFLRLYNLDALPVFADEAIYVRWAQVMRAESTLRFLPLSDGKQPLFMWLVIPFLKVVGDPLFAGRATSVFAGMGTLVGIFLITHYLFKSKKAALVSALIYAVSPFSIFFDRMALADSLLAMFGVWVFLLGLITARSVRLDFAMLTGFALGGALLTKSPALFFSLMLPSTWFLASWPKRKKERISKLIKLTGLLMVTYLIGYGMYNILRLGPSFHLIASRNQDYVLPLSHLWTNPRDPFIFYFDRAFEWVSFLGPWPIWILAPLGFLLGFEKNRKEMLVLGFWYLLPIAAQSEFAKVFTARYILFSLPFLFITAASLFKSSFSKRRGFVTSAFLVIFAGVALWTDYLLVTKPERASLPRSERSGYLEEWTAGTGIKNVALLIRKLHTENPQQKIVVGTEGYFGTLPDGLQIYLNDLPEITVIGVGIVIDQMPSSLKESKEAGNKTFLVVNSSRFKITDPEKLGLRLIASHEKANRPTGFREYVQFGSRDSLLFFEVSE